MINVHFVHLFIRGVVRTQTDVLPSEALEVPEQPAAYKGPITIEAENMDVKGVNVRLTHSGWWAAEVRDFAGMGYVEMQASSGSALRHELQLSEAGDYRIVVRYCNSSKAGQMRVTANGKWQVMRFEKTAMNEWREAVVPVSLKAGRNTVTLTNVGAMKMYIDQVTYEPVGWEREKLAVRVRAADFGQVTADVDSAAAGQRVRLRISPEVGYGLGVLKVVNSVFYTQKKTIGFEEGAREVTFTMPDENVVIQPVFYDRAAVYALDFTDVAGGALPVGWRTTDGTDVRNYPTQNSSGPRTFSGLTGYQGKALYWRTTSAEYGRQSAYPLTLEPGDYELIFAMAAWKGSPTYQAKILSSNGSTLKSSPTLTGRPNLNGNSAGDISTAERETLRFSVTKGGRYIIQFKEMGSGMQEFLLAECRVRSMSVVDGIRNTDAEQTPVGIYSASGVRRERLQRGLNIIVDGKGRPRKVVVR